MRRAALENWHDGQMYFSVAGDSERCCSARGARRDIPGPVCSRVDGFGNVQCARNAKLRASIDWMGGGGSMRAALVKTWVRGIENSVSRLSARPHSSNSQVCARLSRLLRRFDVGLLAWNRDCTLPRFNPTRSDILSVAVVATQRLSPPVKPATK